MRFSFTLLGVLAFLLSTAQSITPSQLVNTTKTKGQSFAEVSCFSVAQQGAYELSRHVGEHQVFKLDEEALAQLLLEQKEAISMELPASQRTKKLSVKLVRVNLFQDGYQTRLASSGRKAHSSAQGVHYRGIIEGEEGSVAAISFFEGELMGLLSAPSLGNLVLGELEGRQNKGNYLLYNDHEVLHELNFDCSASDEGPDYTTEQLSAPVNTRSIDDCVGIYLEIDHDVYLSKGGADGTVNYMTGLFNQVATLYANENINIRLSELFLWDTPSPYYGTSSYALLTQFEDERPAFNGDLGQLISYQASGGIAYLAGLCSNFTPRHSFSSINSFYYSVPTYSFSVMVITHELGHLFGSRHTHACAWNGNNTAIDGCAGFVEGNCPLPGYPAGGGTIMSYCHLRSVGINLSEGFGPQPGNVIRNAVTNASCLSPCDDEGGNQGDDCLDNEVTLSIVLDQYGLETTWEIRDSTGTVIHSGGPYPNTSNGSVIEETFCLKEACYSFEIYDVFGDGICCDFGDGSYELVDSSGVILAEGDAFASSELTDFCLPVEVDSTDCFGVDFSEYDILTFGGAQDAGTYQMEEGETVLKIQNNAWKAIELNYEVTPNTMLELEFKSTIQGEIHGIGFDDNNAISANRTFRVYGMQNWGYGEYDNYPGDGQWKRYTIPVGAYYTGTFDRLFFVSDHDRQPRNGNAYFKNIILFEGDGCGQEATTPAVLADLQGSRYKKNTQLQVFPNPASELITLDIVTPQAGQAHVQVFAMTGQLVHSAELNILPGQNTEQLQVSAWSSGTYLLKISIGTEQIVRRFTVLGNY
jgi:hypothetical protein